MVSLDESEIYDRMSRDSCLKQAHNLVFSVCAFVDSEVGDAKTGRGTEGRRYIETPPEK